MLYDDEKFGLSAKKKKMLEEKNSALEESKRAKMVAEVKQKLSMEQASRPKLNYDLNNQMLELLGELTGPHLRNTEDVTKHVKRPRPHNVVTVPGRGDEEFPPQCQRLIEQVIEVNEEVPGQLRQYAPMEVPYSRPPKLKSLREIGVTDPREMSKYLSTNPVFQ